MLYKVLNEIGGGGPGGHGTWPLPQNGRPGEWMPTVNDPYPWRRGYHLCRRHDLVVWLGPTLYEAEGRGASFQIENMVVYAEARLLRRLEWWDERTAQLFTVDCADRVLSFWTELVAGRGTRRQLQPDARDACAARAAAAARVAAAARAAVWLTGNDARAAARDAADAAWDACTGRDAARDAARAAERRRQTKRLFSYAAS